MSLGTLDPALACRAFTVAGYKPKLSSQLDAIYRWRNLSNPIALRASDTRGVAIPQLPCRAVVSTARALEKTLPSSSFAIAYSCDANSHEEAWNLMRVPARWKEVRELKRDPLRLCVAGESVEDRTAALALLPYFSVRPVRFCDAGLTLAVSTSRRDQSSDVDPQSVWLVSRSGHFLHAAAQPSCYCARPRPVNGQSRRRDA